MCIRDSVRGVSLGWSEDNKISPMPFKACLFSSVVTLSVDLSMKYYRVDEHFIFVRNF